MYPRTIVLLLTFCFLQIQINCTESGSFGELFFGNMIGKFLPIGGKEAEAIQSIVGAQAGPVAALPGFSAIKAGSKEGKSGRGDSKADTGGKQAETAQGTGISGADTGSKQAEAGERTGIAGADVGSKQAEAGRGIGGSGIDIGSQALKPHEGIPDLTHLAAGK